MLWLQAASVFTAEGGTKSIVERSVAQRAHGVILDSGRGRILDRNGETLAGFNIRTLLLLPNRDGFPSPQKLLQLSGIIGANPNTLELAWKALREPAIWTDKNGSPIALKTEQEQRLKALRITGALVVDAVRRYAPDGTAQQLLGFVTEWPERIHSAYSERLQRGTLTVSTPVGASGLELSFDRFLQGVEASSVALYTDRFGNVLPGIGMRQTVSIHPYYPLQLVTTIDRGIQERIEQAADRVGMRRGAIVVLDAQNADVVAMVSRPSFHPEAGLGADGGWRNHALVSLIPGSIFKSVIAAAALEEGVVTPEESFFCDGTYGKYGLTCWKKEGHGRITFEEGFAKSCNIVFAEVAERLSGDTINRYANEFGILGKIGWSGISSVDGKPLSQFTGEESGTVFARVSGTNDGGVLAQTGIGQRDVRVTPLAAANWIVTLLHHGKVLSPRVVSEIRYADGRTMEKYGIERPASTSGGSSMSEATARQVLSMMREVVSDGTGSALKNAKWKVAGKSGTAQVTAQGDDYVNQWFIGYGPVDKPRYAVAVVLEQRPVDSTHASIPLFKTVMDILAEESH